MFGRILPCSAFRANYSLTTVSLFKSCDGANGIRISTGRCVYRKTYLSTWTTGRPLTLRSDNLSKLRPSLLPSSSSSLHLESRRYLFNDTNDNKEFCSPKREAFLRGRDGMPKSYTLIYRSDFGTYVLLIQIVLFLAIGAVMVAAISKLHMGTLSDEEKVEMRRKLLESRDAYRKAQKETDLSKAIEASRKDEDKVLLTAPHPDDMFVDDDLAPEEFAIALLAAIGLAASLFKMQRIIPVRIYMNARNHCVAVKYGHILPGRITYHEFLAGSVKPVEKFYSLHAGSCYKDVTGQYFILMPRFFRQPADYNKVLGYDQEFADEVVKNKVRQREN